MSTENTVQVEVRQTKVLGETFEQLMDQAYESGNSYVKTIISDLRKYAAAMAPGKPLQNNQIGAKHQVFLWTAINRTLNDIPREEFQAVWNIILRYFHQHAEGLFGPKHVFRFPESWERAPAELDRFQRILNLLLLTADPEKRAYGLKQVDINRTMNGFTEDARARIVTFYRL